MSVLPPFEGGDEVLHFNYVQQLAQTGFLPDRAASATNAPRQASGQPPLYYAAAAGVARLLGLPMVEGGALLAQLETAGTYKNPWYSPPDPWNRTDNRNVLLVSIDASQAEAPYTTVTGNLSVLRFTSLAFGSAGVIAAYAGACAVFRGRRWQSLTAAVFALTPQYVHMSAILHNDIAPYALSAVAIAIGLHLTARKRILYWHVLLLGLVIGLAGLSKINALLIAPGIALALLVAWRQDRVPWRIVAIRQALLIVSAAIIILPWMFWGLQTVGDSLGTATHLRAGYYYPQPLTLPELLPLLPEVYLGYWGKLASAVYLSPLVYFLLTGILAMSFMGYLFGRKSGWWAGDSRTAQVILCCLIVVCAAAGLWQWLRTIHFITGRLLYPAHLPLALAVTGGLALLSRCRPLRNAVVFYPVSILAYAAVIAAPLSLMLAYSPVTASALPAGLRGGPIDFDGSIRFAGYRRPDDVLRAPLTRMTLCWEVLQPPSRPAAFAIKVQNGADEVAGRTSVFGMGRFPVTLWQMGDRFCDEVDIPLTGDPMPGQPYNVILIVLDAATGAVDWPAVDGTGQPLPYPLLGQLAWPGDGR
jgi:hypothetical protein